MITDKDLAAEGAEGDRTYPHQAVTREIIAAAFEVHRVLGWGYLEKVYENALAVELRNRGLRVKAQTAIPVQYKGEPVGDYFADLLVNDVVLCEIKAGEGIISAHQAQLLHYLKATKTQGRSSSQLRTQASRRQAHGLLDDYQWSSVIICG